ncbi:transposase [Bacteroidota bacterium]
MFRKNSSYKQQDLFGASQQLTKKQQQLFDQSIEHCFFEHIFLEIDEERFSVLYSNKISRPNVAVNQLVGSLILKHLFDWTYEELFKHLSFNLLTRHAIGIDRMDTDIYAEASLFNFQNRLIEHYSKTGQDLLMEVFDNLTLDQLKQFGIKSDIQRGDSFLIGSNIMDYNRLQLLIEVIKRLYHILDDQDKVDYKDCFTAYINKTSGQYIYRVEKVDLPNELHVLGQHYQILHQNLASKYSQIHVFELFSRVYHEHFTVVSNQVEVRPSNELHSSILMSPDDPEATYREKSWQKSKGYVGHLSETANQENELQLITDIALMPNNVGDAEILKKRLPEMIRKTPDIKEYFTDGQYGGPEVDRIMESNNIKQYQSGIRGRKSYGGLRIHQKKDGTLFAKCSGGQDVQVIKKQGWSATFDYNICSKCPLGKSCTTRLSGTKQDLLNRKWYIRQKQILAHLRINNVETLPEDKRTLRANVEATVRQLQFGMRNRKVRVRTKIRTNAYLVLTAIATNLRRIHSYQINFAPILIDSLCNFLISIDFYLLKIKFPLRFLQIISKQKGFRINLVN